MRKVCLLFILICIYAQAQVNTKNGNFYTSFTDMKLSDHDASIESITRTYNSKSTEVGWFGFGWGSKLETKLIAFPDGYVKLFEHGAGGSALFKPSFIDELAVEELIDLIIEVEIENQLLEDSPLEISNRTLKLEDLNDRAQAYQNLLDKNLIDPYIPSNGTEWNSYNRGSSDKLVFKNAVFTKQEKSGEIETFNTNGQLIKHQLANGSFTKIEYIDGKLNKLSFKKGAPVEIETNEDGFVTKLTTVINGEEKTSTYEYDDKKLALNEDMGFNKFKHTYDEAYNMTSIIYNPVRFKGEKIDQRIIEYYPTSYFTKKITERNGLEREYEYLKFYMEDGTEDAMHYGTKTTETHWTGLVETSSAEWFLGTRASGESFTKKIIITENDTVTENIYDDKCDNLPIKITRDDQWTKFSYDKNCLLTEKIRSTGDSLKLKFDPIVKKPLFINSNGNIHKFKYDDRGNIIYGKKNDEDAVYFTYNSKDKITTIKNGEDTLVFKYNEHGKPSKITIDGIGSINVIYDANNEIERVESEDGHMMAMRVTQRFQNLLQIVKPANVNYNL